MTRFTVALGDRHVGRRLDRALVEALAEAGHEVTRSQVARWFRAGAVRVGDRPVAASFRVRGPTEVVARPPPPEPLRAAPEPMDLAVLYEDGDVLVVDKPAGVLVHPSARERTGTLVAGVLSHLGGAPPVLAGNGPERPGVVHRLDRDTSGIVVFARNARSLAHLAEQFRRHDVLRAYLAVCHGRCAQDVRRVVTRHGRDPTDRRRFSPRVGRRRAESTFAVLARAETATLFCVTLATGRTHQVRVHARWIGHPIVGDPLYGRRRRTVLDERARRQALHAQVLGFVGLGGRRRVFVAPPPQDLRALVAHLWPGLDPVAAMEAHLAGSGADLASGAQGGTGAGAGNVR